MELSTGRTVPAVPLAIRVLFPARMSRHFVAVAHMLILNEAKFQEELMNPHGESGV